MSKEQFLCDPNLFPSTTYNYCRNLSWACSLRYQNLNELNKHSIPINQIRLQVSTPSSEPRFIGIHYDFFDQTPRTGPPRIAYDFDDGPANRRLSQAVHWTSRESSNGLRPNRFVRRVGQTQYSKHQTHSRTTQRNLNEALLSENCGTLWYILANDSITSI